jgi:hypothetical protein
MLPTCERRRRRRRRTREEMVQTPDGSCRSVEPNKAIRQRNYQPLYLSTFNIFNVENFAQKSL